MDKPQNIFYSNSKVNAEERSSFLHQTGATLWIYGLSGSGKSTLASKLEEKLINQGNLAFKLDGDNVRSGLCRDLTFSIEDRKENMRRVAEVAKFFADAGLICLVSVICPLTASREIARNIIGAKRFFEIYVSTPLEICEKRDVKGLYAKARRGEIKDFTGISAPFEPPEHPDFSINTEKYTLEESVRMLLERLGEEKIIFPLSKSVSP